MFAIHADIVVLTGLQYTVKAWIIIAMEGLFALGNCGKLLSGGRSDFFKITSVKTRVVSLKNLHKYTKSSFMRSGQ